MARGLRRFYLGSTFSSRLGAPAGTQSGSRIILVWLKALTNELGPISDTEGNSASYEFTVGEV